MAWSRRSGRKLPPTNRLQVKLFEKYRSLFICSTPNQREVRLSLQDIFKKETIQKYISNSKYVNLFYVNGVMEKNKILSDEDALTRYGGELSQHDAQPQAFEDIIPDDEWDLIVQAVEGN